MKTTMRIESRLRPLRLAFLLDPQNIKHLREAIAISTCCWGGRYNIFVPNYRSTPKNWHQFAQNSARQWKEVVLGYLSVFEIDAIVCLSDEPSWIKQSGIQVLKREDVFGPGGDIGIKLGFSSFHIYKHLYDKEFQFVRRYPRPAVVSRQDAGTSLLTDVALGRFPEGDLFQYRRNYIEVFEAEERGTSASGLAATLYENLTPLKAGSFGVRAYPLWNEDEPVLFLCDSKSWSDMVELWNLRAYNPRVLPLPIERLAEVLYEYAKESTSATFIRSRSRTEEDLKFAVGLWENDSRRSARVSWATQCLWEEDKALRPSEFPRVELSARDTVFEVDVGGSLCRIEGLLPEMDSEPSVSVVKCANVLSLSSNTIDGRVAAVLPAGMKDLRWLLYGSRHARTTYQGIVTFHSWSGEATLMTPQSGLDVFRAWLKDRGFDVELSGAGRTANEILRAVGGPIGAALFVHEEVIRKIDSLVRPEGLGLISASDLRGLLLKLEKHPPAASTRFAELVEHVFALGLKRTCPTCTYVNWVPLKNIGATVDCGRCLKSFRFSQSAIPDKSDWCYRPHGPFAVPRFAHGAYCVALALRFFSVALHGELTWWPSAVLKNSDGEREIDFGLWYRDRGPDAAAATLVLGECKTFDLFRKQDFVRARSLAESFPGSVLVFATLRLKLEPAELKGFRSMLRALQKPSRGPRAQLLILTGNELLGYVGKRELRSKRNPHPSRLAQYVEASRSTYLGDVEDEQSRYGS